MSKISILKVGGSVCTFKEHFSDFNDTTVKDIVMEIHEWHTSKDSNDQLILTTGAGSFGHPLAHRYQINNRRSEKDNLGFVRIVSNMQRMGWLFSETAYQNDLPLFPIPSSSLFFTENGRIVKANLDIILNCLERGLIPYLWGDAVFDLSHKFRILSSDQISTYLYDKLNAGALYYGTNVDGVYTDNPSTNTDAILIDNINDSNYHQILSRLTQYSSALDVTDGMYGKIKEIYQIKKRPVQCLIYNALTKRNTINILMGRKIGTEINFTI